MNERNDYDYFELKNRYAEFIKRVIINLAKKGFSNAEIREITDIPETTVRFHRNQAGI